MYSTFVLTGMAGGGAALVLVGSTCLGFSVEADGGVWLVSSAEYNRHGNIIMPNAVIQDV